MRPALGGEMAAVDGKVLRCSFEDAAKCSPLPSDAGIRGGRETGAGTD